MKIHYCCTHWGSEDLSPSDFLMKVGSEGYSGIEINLKPENKDQVQFFDEISKWRASGKFIFIAQQVLDGVNETPSAYTKRMSERLEYQIDFQPDFINSHTGKDFYSFDDNCRIIDAAENISARSGIPILHETHRGRFTFHLATLLPYLSKFPQLQLTGDFSHWCNVSESMLEDQAENLSEVIPHIGHLHARIGSEQSPQVSNPFAPEWEEHLTIFLNWWKSILSYREKKGRPVFTITTEFGPAPYLPSIPFSREPLANQWEINAQMKACIQSELNQYKWAEQGI